MKLSKQAMGAIMMALQKSLLEQSDIVPVLESFDFITEENEDYTFLKVKNPPPVEIKNNLEQKTKPNYPSGSD